tara:strand:- start:160 stop:306 length:147 start_codon:yes stop_codon:yes gene_type:complete
MNRSYWVRMMKVKCPSCKLIFETTLAARTQVKCKCGKGFGKFRNSILD